MKNESTVNGFGKRLAAIRKDRGLSQRQLADITGISPRMIAYYEAQSKHPPTHYIVPLVKALRVSADELLGLKDIQQKLGPEQVKLWRKFQKISKLSKHDQKILSQMLTSLLKKNGTV